MSRKTFNDRSGDEKKEGYETVKTGMPKERFSEEKQVLTPNELGVTESSIPGTDRAVTTSNLQASVAKSVKSKMKIAPDVSVEELKNTQVGGVPLAVSPGLRAVAGTSSQSPADDTSKVPYTKGDYRPATRYGKKRSEDLFEIDNTISEQIAPVVDDAKDLKDSPDSKQGYNGRKQFTQTRGKKNFVDGTNGKIPQQLLNDVSVDFVHTEKVVYTSGQMIEGIDSQADYPTVRNGGSSVLDNSGTKAGCLGKGNYLPTSFNFTISHGKITDVSITEERFKVDADPVTRDQANMNWQTDANNVAKAMIRMQKELGRETTDKWSPLGYVISQPYEYNMLMHDIEASTGAIGAIAYRAAVSSLAYQRNILAKDGVGAQKNAVKMILEGYAGVLADSTSTTIAETNFDKAIFNKSEYKLGSVAALIAMFDSTTKYKTKADILGLQRSLTLHLAQADNNINPLHCKPNFIKVLDKAHMFSTLSGNYNPMLPIYATRKIRIINPLSLNQFLIGWKNPSTLTAEEIADPLRDSSTGTYAQFAYEYKDVRNKYVTRVQHPVIEGILRWMLKHEGAIANTYGDGEVVIPFEFNFEAPNMLSFMICSASQDILWERNICFRDILFAGDQMTYIWDDLAGLDKLNPLYSSQLTIGKYDEPLKLGKLAPDTAIREFWPTHMCMSDSSTDDDGCAQYFAPWYFNETALTNSFTWNEGFNNEVSAFNMTIPSIRDGVRHEYVDLIKGMDERDIRLSLDRWLRIPVFDTNVSVTSASSGSPALYTLHKSGVDHEDITSEILNDYIKLAALRYEVNSDGRVVVKYIGHNNDFELTRFALYCIPKELGWIEDDYLGRSVITKAYTNNGTFTVVSTNLVPETRIDDCTYYNGYSPIFLSSYRVEANANDDGSIDRAAALSQVFYNCFASVSANTINGVYINKTGIIPCLSYNYAAPTTVSGCYTLNGDSASAQMLDSNIKTMAPRIWTGIQRVFFPINRFENCFTADNSLTAYDPMEGAFYFGVCGTLASDYTQDILERLDVYDQLGLDYTEDVFVKDSLIFR
jgi:hypothetical protein